MAPTVSRLRSTLTATLGAETDVTGYIDAMTARGLLPADDEPAKRAGCCDFPRLRRPGRGRGRRGNDQAWRPSIRSLRPGLCCHPAPSGARLYVRPPAASRGVYRRAPPERACDVTVACRRLGRLAARDAISPRDIEGETFVNVSSTAPTRRVVIDGYLESTGINIATAHEAASLWRSR
jgi:hypothetical protein